MIIPLLLCPFHLLSIKVGILFFQAESISSTILSRFQVAGSMVLVADPLSLLIHRPSGRLISTVATYTPFTSGGETTSTILTSPLSKECPPVTFLDLALKSPPITCSINSGCVGVFPASLPASLAASSPLPTTLMVPSPPIVMGRLANCSLSMRPTVLPSPFSYAVASYSVCSGVS